MSASIILRQAPSGPVVNPVAPGYVLTVNADGKSWSAKPGAGGGAVSSVFGRVGAVVATAGDYAASKITNDSSVSGFTVKDALNTLLASGGAVSSVFGRTGAVVAVANDYSASLISNNSTVTGAQVSDALNTLGTGFQLVANIAGRNAYPNAQRAVGTSVRQVDTNQIWQLQGGVANGNWVDISIGQFDGSGVGATGNSINILAQNEVGAGSTGGALVLGSGTGVLAGVGTNTSPGPVTIQRGAQVIANWTTGGATDFLTLGLPAGSAGNAGNSAASAGNIRTTRTSSWKARSNNDTGDVNVLDYGQLNGTDSLTLGSSLLANGLVLVSGNAGISFNNGASQRASIGNAALFLFVQGLTWVDLALNPVISQVTENTVVTSQPITVQAQNNTFAGSTGGDLVLTSGTGITAAGKTRIQAGGVNKVVIDATGVGFYNHASAGQSADMGAVNDTTGGVVSLNVVDAGAVYSQATLNNNFAALSAQVNKVRTALRATGYMA